ncbi:hypothetical protein IHE44_0007306 [Lamprotornis superbus]|uniref:Target of rapamycin complex 2 subunit MAPKAP1 n=1 Tax=Lamprotornis superbus TaxID=245042 RepID=A0A835NW66_9PASS|nr:hypothetical protein IHE44_0007306 [Lamprotornis superbus]
MGPQYRLEKQSEPNVPVDLDCTLESQSTLEFCLVRENSISGDKVEIDPVTNQKASTKFWIKQKPISIDSELLCACDLAEEKSPTQQEVTQQNSYSTGD